MYFSPIRGAVRGDQPKKRPAREPGRPRRGMRYLSASFLAVWLAGLAGAAVPDSTADADHQKPVDVRPEKRSDTSMFDGAPTEAISLKRAIEMALQNNLEARFERVGISLQGSQLRFAAGAFDPAFSFSLLHQSIRVPQDVNNPNTAQAIESQQQLQVQLNQAAQALNVEATTLAQQITNQSQEGTMALQQGLASVNLQRQILGLSQKSADTAISPTLGLLSPTPITQPVLDNVVVLDQQSTQGVMGLQGRLPYGTKYEFQISADRFRDTFAGDPNPVTPLFQDFAGLTIQQPLLKNFGKDANLADLRVAQLNKKTQVLTWKQNVSTAVQGVMSNYYDMVGSLQDMHVREDAITADSKLVELYKRRVELGFSTPLDVQQAEVAVSTDREAFLTAKNNFLERQFSFKRLILAQYDAKNVRIFIPEGTPSLVPPPINRTHLLSLAFEKRYDYKATLVAADVQDVRLKFAKNQLLPELDLVGTYGFNGLDASFARSNDQIFNGATPQWSVGFNFQFPLGNRQAKAQYSALAGQKEQAILKIKEIELTIANDLDTIDTRIETNRQRTLTSRQTRELGEEAVRIAYRRLDEGLISAFDVIDQQRKLYDAKSREIAAIAELNKSVTLLWLVTGTILERQSIGFEEPVETVKVTPFSVTVKERKPGKK
jgi:outer membrane protein TolC